MKDSIEFIGPTEITVVLWGRKWLLAIIGIACGVAAFSLSFLISPRYEATVVLLPDSSDENGGLSGLLARASGLASIVGLSAGTGGAIEAVEFLKAADLRSRFIEENALIPVLFSDRLASDGRSWLPHERAPTDFEAVKIFGESVLSVRQDPKTGVVTVAIDWTDPITAKQWANAYVALADRLLRERAIREAKETLTYLAKERETSGYVSVQQAISAVMERQIAQIAMAQSRAYYAYRIIDPAKELDETAFYWPRRVLLALAGATLGVLVGMLFAVVSAARRHRVALDQHG